MANSNNNSGKQGLASMSESKKHEIQSKGGKASHGGNSTSSNRGQSQRGSSS